jgi:O-succinylbenzoate synthase
MRIEEISLTHVRVPLVESFRISSGSAVEKDAIVIAVRSEGLTGYGESSPMAGAFYSSDTPERSWEELRTVVVPALLGREFASAAEWNAVLDTLPAGKFTVTGPETALWDLAAQRARLSLATFLGGSKTAVESGLAIGLYDKPAEMLARIERYLADGYKRVKIKIEPGRDVQLVRAVRQTFGDIPLYVDANGAYSLGDLDIFRRLDEENLMMFEQPFPGPDLEALAELQAQVKTPVCLDESLESAAQLRRAIELGSARIANFKLQRIGGFYHALEMLAICREHDVPAWVGTMPELGIGGAQGIALASLDGFVYPTDVEASTRWFSGDIVSPLIEVRNGCIEVPSAPGLGYQVSASALKRYAVASETFSAGRGAMR